MLGTIGMLGGLFYMIAGLRMLLFHHAVDFTTDVLGILWAACWVCGGIALLALRVTGWSRFRLFVSVLLIAGFFTAMLWGIHRLIDQAAADRGPFAVAPIIVILGMLGTGIFALASSPWRGWRRCIPLLIAIVYIISIVINVVRGAFTLPYTFTIAGLGYVLLGDSIRVHDAISPESTDVVVE